MARGLIEENNGIQPLLLNLAKQRDEAQTRSSMRRVCCCTRLDLPYLFGVEASRAGYYSISKNI